MEEGGGDGPCGMFIFVPICSYLPLQQLKFPALRGMQSGTKFPVSEKEKCKVSGSHRALKLHPLPAWGTQAFRGSCGI